MRPPLNQTHLAMLLAALLPCTGACLAADENLGTLSLAQLMNEPVTSVSKRATKLSDSAAAITVITQDDIRRLGITSVPDALRLVPGMDVARISSNEWAISARGFDKEFADKLLVLIDGRTVYTPTSGGVFWNAQDLMVEDIERIEVIRGPGATLWGSNAVNGVVNITTKRASDTQGGLVSVLQGNDPDSAWAARYGGGFGGDLSFRVYAKYLDQAALLDSTHTMGTGGWYTTKGGFRVDWAAGADEVTVQGDVNDGHAFSPIATISLQPPTNGVAISESDISGDNLLGRWAHSFTADSVLTAQTYVAHAVQGDGYGTDRNTTYDVDVQHRVRLNDAHDVVWGTGYRRASVTDNYDSPVVSWSPLHREVALFNLFGQDEVTLLPGRLHATVGIKFENSSLSSHSVEPNLRLLWTPTEQQTVWSAISRAVRDPALFELDARANEVAIAVPGSLPAELALVPNPTLQSEIVTAYELGYRYTPARQVSVDIASFWNHYTRLIVAQPLAPSIEEVPVPHVLLAQMQENSAAVQTYGVEASANWQVLDGWRVAASYSWLHVDSSSIANVANNSPLQQWQARSYLDLPHHWELNSVLAYVGPVSVPFGAGEITIRAYVRADLGVLWHPSPKVSLGIWGRNLLHQDHLEYPDIDATLLTEISRSVVGKITWAF